MRVWWIPLVLVLLLVSPHVAARGGGPLSESSNILWVQYTNDPSCCETWMGTIEADPAFAGSGRYGTQAFVPGVIGGNAFEYPLEPPLTGTVTMLPDSSASATVYIGSSTPTVGQVELTSKLLLGPTVVAEGVGDALFAGTEFTEVVIDMPMTVAALDPGVGALVWSIQLTGGASGDVRICHIEECGHTNLALPVAAGAPPTGGPAEGTDAAFTFLDVEGPVFDGHLTSDGAGSLVQRYNWTAPALDGVRLSLDAQIEEGLAAAMVHDPTGQEVVLWERNATDVLEETLPTAHDAGVWTIVLSGENLTGGISLRVEAAPAGEGEAQTPEDPRSASAPDEGQDEDSEPLAQDPAASEKESPGLPVLAVSVLVAFAAARSRRP